MATAVTMVRRLSFKKIGLTDRSAIFYRDFAMEIDRSIVEKVVKEVESAGYESVRQSVIITFPP